MTCLNLNLIVLYLFFLAAAGSEEEVPAWGAWSSCQRDGYRTRLQVCDEAPCPSETEECIFYGNVFFYSDDYRTYCLSFPKFQKREKYQN